MNSLTYLVRLSNTIKNSTLITLRSEEGETVKDQTKVAGMLANYFSTAAASIGGNHVSNLTEGDLNGHKNVKSIRENFNGTCFTFKKFSMEEMQYAIENINPGKLRGWDRSLSPKLLKKVAGEIVPSLTTICTMIALRPASGPRYGKWESGPLY